MADDVDACDDRTSKVAGRRHRTTLVVLVVGFAYLAVVQVTALYDRDRAVEQATQLAEPVDRLCRDDPDARRAIGVEDCRRAADVQRDPVADQPRDGADGADGTDGGDGRGITGTSLVNGHLVVAYTDGTRDDVGAVVGTTGPGGPAGRGVVATTLDVDGRLVVTYTDGAVEVLGRVVGTTGPTGRGVDRVEVREGRLVVFYDDGPDVPVDAGPLPVGPPGPPGRGITSLDLDLASCKVTIYYTDGVAEVRDVTGCEPDDAGGGPPDDPPPTS